MRQTSRPQTNPRRRPSYNHTDDNYNHSYATQPAWLTATVTATLHGFSSVYQSHGVGDIPYKCITLPWNEKERIEQKDRYIDEIEGGDSRKC